MGPYLSAPITSKTNAFDKNKDLRYAACEMQGWRKSMEDARIHKIGLPGGISVFGVFDGHGGFEVARFVEKNFVPTLLENPSYKKEDYSNALIETFKKLDEMIESPTGAEELRRIRRDGGGDNSNSDEDTISSTTGCTGNVLIITPTKYYVANAGDSRCVLSRSWKAIPLSEDHKPEGEVEKARIAKAGGTISNGRVNGGLNLSRSLGDFFYKRDKNLAYDEQLIISKPDVTVTDRTKDDEFIIMGCDGIWEKYVNNSQGMVDKIIQERKSSKDMQTVISQLLDFLVAKDTSEEVGCDNMTGILIEFNKAA